MRALGLRKAEVEIVAIATLMIMTVAIKSMVTKAKEVAVSALADAAAVTIDV